MTPPRSDAGNEGLLACPFCGNQPQTYWQSGGCREFRGYWAIECCSVNVHEDNELDASGRWNTRAALRAPPHGSGGVREALQSCWNELDKAREKYPDQATGTWTLALAMIARRIKRLDDPLSLPSGGGEGIQTEHEIAGLLANAIFAENLQEMPTERDEYGPSWCQDDMLEAAREIQSAGFEIRKISPLTALTGQNSGPTAGREGRNGCILVAAKALDYLADHTRPSGGQESYNAEHLIQLAYELRETARTNSFDNSGSGK